MRGSSLPGRRPRWILRIAEERMDILFQLADKEFSKHPERSHRYVELARRISKKYNLRIPRKWKRRFCKSCYKFLKPGYNCRIRLSRGKIHYQCLECGRIMRFPYIREKKLKRRNKIEYHTSKKRADEKVPINNNITDRESRSQ
ncbi:MAG TPA: ribonuclease P [Methanobacteriales archaeon]|nr:ribonuclease P [Methanobacteriaceae archaeon]MBC7097410.1 ribonuclease P [Methanobacteriales archaeon]HIH62271.1 ribonuclease P [Methanobacteriales archaeon]